MLHFQIDPHSGIPVYRQMMNQVKYYVAAGVLKTGDQLPSIRELARAVAVNPTTVVKAYNELHHEGVIEMKHGKGVFIVESAPGMTDEERAESLRRLAKHLAVEAKQMGAPEELTLRVVREEIEKVSGTAAAASSESET